MSSAVSVPSGSGAVGVLCETQCMPHRGQYELIWDPKPPSRMTKNPNVTYVWAIVKRSTNVRFGPGTSLRVHMCAHNPCLMRRPTSTKYGPSVHMQCMTCMDPTTAPLLHPTAAPAAEPSSTTTAVAAYTPTVAAISVGLATDAADGNTREEIGASNG